MRKKYYIDMHCHPSIKPYSWYDPDDEDAYDCRNIKTSLWFNDPPKETDKKLNKRTGLTRFSQSDFRTLTKGDVKIASAVLGPTERGLFIPRGPCKWFGLRLLKFGLELNPDFIRRVKERDRDYLEELNAEYDYFLSEQAKQHDRTFPTHFELTKDYDDIEPLLENVDADRIYIFFSIEGCHVFNNGGLRTIIEDEDEVRGRIQEVKDWEFRPLYVSVAHQINNDLCGHAKSLPPKLGRLVDQTERMGEGFADMGRVVVHKLLDNANDKRIHIDIKHMSAQSREDYYGILADDYQNEDIPIIASHGAVNGRQSLENRNQEVPGIPLVPDLPDEDADRYQNEDELKFNNENINFFDDEIIAIQKSKGFLGIQIDERRLILPEQLEIEKEKDRNRGDQLFYQAGLIWKQIRYIAELLDNEREFGWGVATIGSDYDGAVDPPNGYWTADDFGILEENLIHHAVEYFTNHANRLDHDPNKLNDHVTPEEKAVEVINLFMRRNAERFLSEYLHQV